MPLVIENVTLYHRFSVVKALKQSTILGKDQITEHKVIMDFEKGDVSFEIHGIPVKVCLIGQVRDKRKIDHQSEEMKEVIRPGGVENPEEEKVVALVENQEEDKKEDRQPRQKCE